MKRITFILLAIFIAANFSFGQIASYQRTDLQSQPSEGLTLETVEQLAYEEANSSPADLAPQEDYPDMNSRSRADMVLEEYFDTEIPGTWTINVFSGTGVWEWTDTYPWPFYSFPDSDGNFAMTNSNGNTDLFDVGLETPSMDWSSYGTVTVDFDRNFQSWASTDFAAVFAGNATDGWVELWSQNVDDPSAGAHFYMEIETATLTNPADVQLAFYSEIIGTNRYGFLLDNVIVQGITAGDVEGYVINGAGQSIGGVDIFVGEDYFVSTDASGYYRAAGVNSGMQDITAMKTGYNTQTQTVDVIAGGTVQVDFTFTSPNITLTPLIFDETLHPNEYLTTYLSLLNTGDGSVDWAAGVVYPAPPPASSNITIPPFTGTLQESDIPTSAGLDQGNHQVTPISETTMSLGSRADIAIGFNAFFGIPNQTVSFDYEDHENSQVTLDSDPLAGGFFNGMAYPRGDASKVYAVTFANTNLYEMDPTDGIFVDMGALSGTTPAQFNDITVDPSTGIFYGTGGADLYIIDPAGMTSTLMGSHGGVTLMIGIACDAAGDLWGYDITNDALYSIDKNTGAASMIGPIGYAVGFAQSMFYDEANDMVLLAAYQGGGVNSIRVADRATGNTVAISSGVGTEMTAAALPVGGGGGAGGWLTLSDYSGSVAPAGGTFNIGVNFSAAGTVAGEVYHADIVVSTNPFVGEITVPVTMTIAGDPLPGIDGFTAELTDPVTGEVTLMWNAFREVTFEYYLIKRNGGVVASTTDPFYTDMLPGFGTYDYTVQPVYLEGEGPLAGPETIEWYEPELCYDNYAENTQWTNTEQQVIIELENCADDGVLWFEFPEYVDASRDLTCDYTVEMSDSFGDGWNGNSLDLYLDGVYVGTAELLSGSSGSYTFEVYNGAEITGIWNYGLYVGECSYDITDCDGEVVYSGVAGDIPAGTLYALVPALFVIDVEPATGNINAGETLEVVLTYSSMGYPEGDYTQDIFLITNEPDAPPTREQMHYVENWMYVVEPASITGMVTDCNTGAPLANVTVTAETVTKELENTFTAETAEDGTYMMYVNQDSDYAMTASKVGYGTEMDYVSVVMTAEVDFELCEEPYPVTGVVADPNEADTECMVTWTLPMGPYLIAYDDGTAEDYFAWVGAGGSSAVKFTPAGYPATVEGGRIFVGDGSFPEGGSFLGSLIAVGVLDDDGAGGMPGTVLDSAAVTVDNYGWVDINEFNITLNDGDFYIVMWQLGASPNVAPVGVDLDVPTVYRSYVKASDGEWMVSVYNDFMMRAVVSGPGENVMAAAPAQMIYPGKLSPDTYVAMGRPNGVPGLQGTAEIIPVIVDDAERDLETYQLWRISDIDPDGGGNFPEDGTHLLIQPALTGQMYNDTDWEDLDPGFYAYAIVAVYTNGDESEMVYSNIAAHEMDNMVTLTISQCDGESPEGANVRLASQNYPFQILTIVTDATGLVVFDSVINGIYDLDVMKEGYGPYEHNNIYIFDDYEETIVLQENAYPAKNFSVEALTSWATWEAPASVQLPEEGFEDTGFPPAGWTTESNGVGWFRTNSGGSAFFPIPPGDGFYACVNDDVSDYDGCCDYLIIPPVDLRGTGDYMLYFSSYYDASFGQLADVEVSIDGGDTWTLLFDVPASTDWQDYEVSLADYAGYGGDTPVYIAFHADDAGFWASGWAVDNVMVTDGHMNLPIAGYQLFLDGGYVASVGPDVLEYQYQNLQYGVTYEACVVAEYACGVSEPTCETFTSSYLYPPRNLRDEYVYGTNEAPLFWNPPVTVAGPAPVMFTLRELVDLQPAPAPDGRSYLTRGETPLRAPLTFDLSNNDGSRDDLDIAIVSSALPGSNDFSEISAALIALGINSVTEVDIETAPLPTVDDLLAYDALLFAFNTFFTTSTIPTGDLLADYIDAGGKLVMTVPTFITGFTGTPIEGRLLDDGYYALTPGPGPLGTESLGTFDPDHPIMDGVVDCSGSLRADCGVDPDAELVASYADGAPLVGVKESVIGINGFFGAPGNWTGDMDLIVFNALNFLQQGGNGGGAIPDGLISFNVYNGGTFVANVPYDGQGSEDWVPYVENDLMPECYDYEVTAVYDLTDYGFPGMTAESDYEGPHEVCVVWGIDLPFCEDFTQGTFEFNGWVPSGDNWVINSQVGNDMPSAQFNWDPDPGADYSVALTSSPFNADMLSEGDIWLDLEVALDDRNGTGDEMLKVEVYNGSSWTTLATFDNAGGSFDFTFSHLKITDYAKGGVFMVRFNAMGANSFDVIAWNVDNVCLYRTCAAPYDLTGEYVWNEQDDFGAEICWEADVEEGPVSEWIFYHDGTWEAAYADTDGGAGIAQLFTPEEYPCTVTEVRYFNNSEQGGDFENVYVLTGDGATILAGPYSVAYPGDGTWVTVDVDDVTLTEGTFMVWTENVNAGGPFIAVDTDTYDGTLYFGLPGNFTEMGEFSIFATGSHEAYVTYGATANAASVNSTVLRPAKGELRSTIASAEVTTDGVVARPATRSLNSFNVYRSTDGGNEYNMLTNVAAEPGVSEYCYFDMVSEYPVTYCYKVTAVYEGETDYCESDPALAYANPTEDFVCILITDVENPLEASTVLYPNPASDFVRIASGAEITQITVINYVGQLVYDSENEGVQTATLNTGSYEAGVYVVKINTTGGLVTKRMIISR